MSKPRVMVVDDDVILLESIRIGLHSVYEVDACESPLMALQHLYAGNRYDAIVTDMQMPDMDGLRFLRQVGAIDSEVSGIMLTGYADLETAMAAINDCRVSYILEKPCPLPELMDAIDICVDGRVRDRGVRKVPVARANPLDRFIGQSPAAIRVRATLERLGREEANILLTGESGSGKNLAAEILHALSPRASMPFVAVSCPGQPSNFFDVTLFGAGEVEYTEGSSDFLGKIMSASGGSLLLDEIGDIPRAMQAKLLQVVERRKTDSHGESLVSYADLRIMAATNINLAEAVHNGLYRKDLYYRLNAMSLELPSLRDRREDIPMLARYFLTEFGREFGQRPPSLTPNALSLLGEYDWPGNIRELKHVMRNGAAICRDRVIHVDDLPRVLTRNSTVPSHRNPAVNGRDNLLSTLNYMGWNKSKAARALAMSRSTLYRKMQHFGIPIKEYNR